MLADRPLEEDTEDRLDFGAYAEALTELIDNPKTATPLSIALSAPWGAGKTSLAKMVHRRLVSEPVSRGARSHIVCWFNAWMHDDAPHLGSAFAADVAKEVSRFRGWRRVARPLPSKILSSTQRLRRGVFLTGAFASVMAVAVAYFASQLSEPDANIIREVRGALGATAASLLASGWLLIVAWNKVFPVAKSVASFVNDPGAEAARGSMAEVSNQLGTLIAQATAGRRMSISKANRLPRRVVIFVDDLERCKPPRAVEVCEVASQLLAHPQVVTVFVADMRVITASADIKYSSLERRSVGETQTSDRPIHDYGRLYLQKMVQIQFDLPESEPEKLEAVLESGAASQQTVQRQVPSATRRALMASYERLKKTTWGKTILLGAIGLVVGIATSLFIERLSPEDQASLDKSLDATWFQVLSFLPILVSLPVIIVRFIRGITQARRARATHKIDLEIKQIGHEQANLETLERDLLKSESAQKVDPSVIRQRIRRHVVDDSVLRQQAESEIITFLPQLPRSAKRMVNHLRLLLVMATNRRMLGGTPPLRPGHLGKWVVLGERWPEIAQAIKASPSQMSTLEEARTEEELAVRVAAIAPADVASEAVESQDLFRFLATPTKLGQVVDRLVFLRAAETEQAFAVDSRNPNDRT